MTDTSQTVTIEDIDALITGATPQFSMQIKARVFALINHLDAGDSVRVYGEQQMQLLDMMAMGTTRGVSGKGRPPYGDEGWSSIPSHPASTS